MSFINMLRPLVPLLLALCVLLLLSPLPVQCSIRLPLLVSNNMILPRSPQQPRLWGWATPAAEVTVTIVNEAEPSITSNVTTTANELDGSWLVLLPEMTASTDPHTVSFIEDDDDDGVSIGNVKIGDVFLCSGQSNMQMAASAVFDNASIIAASINYPSLHLFSVRSAFSNFSVSDVNSTYWPPGTGWLPSSPASVSCPLPCDYWQFSALCLLTGMQLYDALALNGSNVPIGLIASSLGGSPVAAWTSPAAQAQCGSVPPLPSYDNFDRNQPSVLYNAMIAPLLNMQLTAVLWYQGETDSYDWYRYACSFPAMITDWRQQFRQYELPFYFVLLAAWNSGGMGWIQVRQSQLAALTLLHTGVASAIDLGDLSSPGGSNHPRLKEPIAHRLLLLLLRDLYGWSSLIAVGPEMVQGEAAATASGLQVKGMLPFDPELPQNAKLQVLNTSDCWDCCSLSVPGLLSVTAGGVSYPVALSLTSTALMFSFQTATALADGTVLTIGLEQETFPQCALYNAEMLPALPFWVNIPLGGVWLSSTAGGSTVTAVPASAATAGTAATAAFSSFSSSSTASAVGPVTPASPASSSSASPALVALLVVFVLLTVCSTGLFVWQYRKRVQAAAMQARGGDLAVGGGGGGGSSIGLGQWWRDTVGVGKKLEWKRGLSDAEVLRQVASDTYD